jgi:hypothetical protein
VWNALIPKSAVEFKIEKGVRYLHATKGWKWVGKKRFAIRGSVTMKASPRHTTWSQDHQSRSSRSVTV